MKLGTKGRRAAIEILIECLQAKLATMPPDDSDTAPTTSTTPVQSQPAGAPPLMGRPMVSKFGGKCCVCNGSIQQGVPVIYNGATKRTAHAACGVDDGGARRVIGPLNEPT